jgi:hypothetical protein
MSEIREWTILKCDCGGDKFEELVHLKFRTGGGTTTEPAGHRCIACNGIVDNQRMIRLIELAKLRQEIKEKEAEIEAKSEPRQPAPAIRQ